MKNDIIGRRFGMLTVETEEEPVTNARGHRTRIFNCLCNCGNTKLVRYNDLVSGHTYSCGCTKAPKKPPADLTGRKFYMLTVISEAKPHVQKCGHVLRRWNCLCDCGRMTTVLQVNLVSPRGTKSCGCMKGRTRPQSLPNLVGNRYGRLTVLSEADPIIRGNHRARRAWLCLCDCGKKIIKAEDNLLSGHTRSCGCLRGHSVKGSKIGKLTVLKRHPSNTSMRYWDCRCECGNSVVVSQEDLDWGFVTDCGCSSDGKPRLDLTGQTFGKLTALREVEPVTTSQGRPVRAWLCRCSCGREVVVRHYNLTKGVTRSCGCLRSEKQWRRVKKKAKQP